MSKEVNLAILGKFAEAVNTGNFDLFKEVVSTENIDPLFELIVGYCVRELEGGSVDLGLIVLDIKNGKRAEIDVRLVKQRQIRVYECKGYQPESMVPHTEIEKWLTERVPTIYAAHRQQDQFSNATIGFEFWTCGSFDPESVKLLTEAKKATRKYTIDWKNRRGGPNLCARFVGARIEENTR